jgi:glycerophosphoryl diester phosphodiesterase
MVAADKPIVIAHRGASGYLPEHTLEAKALAYGQGADYLEQDVVLTRDGIPVVLHDIHVDTVTDVAEKFPDRKREDGRYYAIDFTQAELKQLSVNERIDLKTGNRVFPGRFPAGRPSFQIPTLAEEIQLVQGLNASTGGHVGIYVEIKQPAWHKEQGQDITPLVLAVLKKHGYTERKDSVFLQCFDPHESRRIREKLGCRLKLVQLIGENDWADAAHSDIDYEQMRTPSGLKEIAEYADGIGPRMQHIITGVDAKGQPQMTDLVKDAHAAGLVVHPYTFRKDDLPGYADSFEQCLKLFCDDAHIDGFFTDFPDLAAKALRSE